ncbi:hypothetical protein CR105_26320 [Massilia eurypsychrophila]|jgi:hypothetical protein|uniref:Copper resistance protein CopB n=1 Tax=Massilia eurypsychrophila TaxID=1485217 RepID=A0A2G8T7Q3_9BURK|nr:hypothetical protein [Massilia eurypsychrophila]PIL42071.1 hypothetical protein CR105_26320 [Massilia eurypsychrophila]
MQLNFLCPLLVLAIAPSAALAQAPSHPGATAAPPPTSPVYQSAFADYKPYKEPVVLSWRETNDQVRDSGGMQEHDMATMKSQSDDPHAGHDMTTGAKAGAGIAPIAKKTGQDRSAHAAKKAPAGAPHAGHDMSKMTPAKSAPAAPPTTGVPLTAKQTDAVQGGKQAQGGDPHAGHDMSKMPPAPKIAPSGADKANHGSYSARPNQPHNKKEKE